jgi:hypothetical protein
MPIGVTKSAGKQISIKRASHVGSDRVAEVLCVEGNRMIFVNRLTIDHWFDGSAVVIYPGLRVTFGELGDVAVAMLKSSHLIVEPLG